MPEPRNGHVQVSGLPWLARMIDKARLERQGEINRYDLEYPCPMDKNLLRQLGIDAHTFQDIAVTAQTDEQIVSELKRIGAHIS